MGESGKQSLQVKILHPALSQSSEQNNFRFTDGNVIIRAVAETHRLNLQELSSMPPSTLTEKDAQGPRCAAAPLLHGLSKKCTVCYDETGISFPCLHCRRERRRSEGVGPDDDGEPQQRAGAVVHRQMVRDHF